MDTHEIAYIAGIFDGEGWVSFRPRKDTHNSNRLIAGIAQKDRMILDWVKERIGVGGIYKTNDKSGSHKYQITNEAARIFLRTILPYTRIKTDKINECLALDAKLVKRRIRPVSELNIT